MRIVSRTTRSALEQRREESLLSAVPRDRRKVYDMRKILNAVVYKDSLFEMSRKYGGPVITALADSRLAPVVGLNYKDTRQDALPWLKRNGDPYAFSVFDATGRIGIDYGVYGVPETYVIDRKGVIRYKHIGPLSPEASRKKVQPLLKELAREG